MGEAVLELKNVTKKYGSRIAVDNLSLTVNSGEVFGFIGPNGAGKTTTIKMIVGLASINSGEINICGHSIKSDFEKAIRNVGGIIENPELYGYLTGRQNLELFAGLYDGITKERVNETIKLVGLSSRIDDKLKKYSLGMRQRTGIAQSLLHSPKILILDEPTNGLDPSGIHEMRDLLKRLSHEHGVAVFISSHILSEMQLLCDRAAIIDHGRLINVLSLEHFNNSQQSKYLIKTDNPQKAASLIGGLRYECIIDGSNVSLTASEDNIPYIIKLLVENGIAIFFVRQIVENLEESFLTATRGSRIN